MISKNTLHGNSLEMKSLEDTFGPSSVLGDSFLRHFLDQCILHQSIEHDLYFCCEGAEEPTTLLLVRPYVGREIKVYDCAGLSYN